MTLRNYQKLTLFAHAKWKHEKRELLGPEVEWTSDDESIVSVDNGVVTAKRTGKVTLHAARA